MALFNRSKKKAKAAAAAAAKGKGAAPEKQSQLAVIKDAFTLVKREKPSSLLLCGAAFIIVWALGITWGASIHQGIYLGIISLPMAFIVAFFMFTRFANTAAFSSIENQLGAGASVLMGIRKGISTTPAVNVNRNQDMVHRSVSRAGIILTGEGGNAVRQLVQDEKKKSERYVPGVPVTEIFVGSAEGQIPLRKLQKHVKKLPKKLSQNQVREVRNRLKAIGGMSMPIPQGPLPKGAKLPRK